MTAHGERAWPDVDAATETLLVPLGSTEQHGPHLPFDTDSRIAVAVAVAAADRVGDVVVAPSVDYGSSGEHQAFAGTLSIGTEALEMVLVELGRSALPPFARMVFVNGHGGNAPAVRAAVELLVSEGRPVAAWHPDLSGVEPCDAHAGHTETSLLLALAPDAVRLDRAEVGNTEPLADLASRLTADGVVVVAPNGVLGDPRAASADHGRRLFEDLVDSLVALLT
jgi:mycofactocin system creatininase family protein